MDWDRPQHPFHTIILLAPSRRFLRRCPVRHRDANPLDFARGLLAVAQRIIAKSLLGILLVLALSCPVSAQDPSAPPPSPTANVLYAHHHDSDTEELDGWMNTLVTDPTGNDIALGPADPAAQPLPERVYTFTLAPALQAPFTLDPSGNIVIDAYIGAGGSQGVVRVSTEITYGGEVVASGAAQNHVYQQAGTAAYPKVTWTVAPEITEFQPGNDLVWTVTLSGIAGQTVFMSVSAERGSSGVTLPILTGGSAGGSSTSGSSSNTTTPAPTNGTVSASGSPTSTPSASTSGSLSVSTSSASASVTNGAATSTTNGTADASKDSPAPPLAFAGLAVLLAAFAARRRLR